jgi:hypothetical protein
MSQTSDGQVIKTSYNHILLQHMIKSDKHHQIIKIHLRGEADYSLYRREWFMHSFFRVLPEKTAEKAVHHWFSGDYAVYAMRCDAVLRAFARAVLRLRLRLRGYGRASFRRSQFSATIVFLVTIWYCVLAYLPQYFKLIENL